MLEKITYEDNLPVKVQILELGSYPWHFHSDIQICYVLSGEVELKLTYGYYHIKENGIQFIHSEDIHGFESLTETSKIILLSFDIEYFSTLFPNLGNQVFSIHSTDPDIIYTSQALLRRQIFSLVLKSRETYDHHRQVMIESATGILKTLHNDFRNFMINDNKSWEHRGTHDVFQIDRISRIVAYIYANYNCKISLSAIAAAENMNTFYLSHLFQRFVGASFRDFLNMTRAEISEYDILATDKAISKIAMDVGFSNYNYYVDSFKKWFGMHPKEYRQKFRERTVMFAKPQARILPLDAVLDLIEKDFSRITVLENSNPQRRHITLDLAQPQSLRSVPDDERDSRFFSQVSGHLFEHVLAAKKSGQKNENPAQLYHRAFPQDYCISLLKRASQSRDLSLPHLQAIDTSKNKNGIFAVNGMKKPLYYLCMFWLDLYGQISDAGPGYIVTRNHENYSILAFNDDPLVSVDMTFNFANIAQSHKLTQKLLAASSSCIDYWCQLNFQNPINPHDYECIEQMTVPKVSFQIVPSTKNHQHSLLLAPLDIAHLSFTCTG
ncbi:AraC family transcriptional regulator [Anaerovorax odorimutans]|uniref:AraC family transcriptional regulator n=1 Tax=Anaerovorax odorimutans TaxID=109327 RepID=A0ABT1RQX2_9FIRM|nr:AraC family transcriptional regulator [Anaerovorax odorimutans]MCQ4637594.1 AraC family transcriptional regulator [Anaerovorax odorimutans]